MPHLLLENVLPQNEGPIAVPNNEMSLIDEVGLEIDMHVGSRWRKLILTNTAIRTPENLS
jgi:hypothetical protein